MAEVSHSVDKEEVARFRAYWKAQDEIEYRQRVADYEAKKAGKIIPYPRNEHEVRQRVGRRK